MITAATIEEEEEKFKNVGWDTFVVNPLERWAKSWSSSIHPNLTDCRTNPSPHSTKAKLSNYRVLKLSDNWANNNNHSKYF